MSTITVHFDAKQILEALAISESMLPMMKNLTFKDKGKEEISKVENMLGGLIAATNQFINAPSCFERICVEDADYCYFGSEKCAYAIKAIHGELICRVKSTDIPQYEAQGWSYVGDYLDPQGEYWSIVEYINAPQS